MNLGMTELIVIFAIILVLFGGRRLPGLGKALGDTIREFKDGISDKEDRVEKQAQLPAQPSTQIQGEASNQNLQSISEKDKTKA